MVSIPSVSLVSVGAFVGLLLSGFFANARVLAAIKALKFILQNNHATTLAKLQLLHDSPKGLFINPELAELADILGYTLSGSADNPIITVKSVN